MRERDEYVSVWVNDAGKSWLDGLSTQFGVSRSDVVRFSLAVAKAHEAELKTLLKAKA